MKLVIDFILLLLFNESNFPTLIFRILYIIGAAAMLHKSGLKWYYALIPAYREYKLACCALRENIGRVYFIVFILDTIVTLFLRLYEEFSNNPYNDDKLNAVLTILLIVIVTSELIFNGYIYYGFTKVYKISKAWILLGIFNESQFIPLIIWGFVPRYQPKAKIDEIDDRMNFIASYGAASPISDGLTVNLYERHVIDFFKKKYLLKDIHLTIPAGHMVLLLGGSGAGKTTFLNAVNGYEKANAEILLDGIDLYKNYSKMIHQIGFVPQMQMMRDKDSVIKTLNDAAYLRLPKRVKKAARQKRVEEVMNIFGLTPVSDSLVEKLSGGQKKRLSISMELISNPSLFILDEPDSGLDGVMARELFSKLRDVADTGKIIIVITHSPDRVIDYFDDVIVLAKDSNRTGRLAFYGSIKEAKEFFERDSMEEIVKSVNQIEEGGDGLADEYIIKYARATENEYISK